MMIMINSKNNHICKTWYKNTRGYNEKYKMYEHDHIPKTDQYFLAVKMTVE